ncbi:MULTISPECIES: hypothetical protein [Rhizobium/Agrobacterium group]|uniref:hypothetical protein n=1 Tax=Rhizobium/Agrobacterium group TaxID=227290 RepID=UPI001ADB06E0|nr:MULTISPECIES: hypothetical protein [Rhizobium/Agrobacterium group]MBO9112636.1 hypothetical protein [Agrobacterium sp. S2/73]QXZ76622.1 hypothetical protein J5276_29230 [Agrobacterium sp. S7/73]QYA17377.1 hypothetical protein J5284_32285 [Rhizobium sp. AB2/73]UEQ85694.1 hypothetical protein I8E17_31775 [Rhizobium sp. AB2/73]
MRPLLQPHHQTVVFRSFFNRLDNFGRDRDEAPAPVDPDIPHRDRKVPKSAWSAFLAHPRDITEMSTGEAANFVGRSVMTPRLWSLARFLISKMAEIPALGWATGLREVHPYLVRGLEQHLRYQLKDDGRKLPHYWRYLLARWAESERDPDQIFLYIQNRVKQEGRSASIIREAVARSQPVISINRTYGLAPPMAAKHTSADCQSGMACRGRPDGSCVKWRTNAGY